MHTLPQRPDHEYKDIFRTGASTAAAALHDHGATIGPLPTSLHSLPPPPQPLHQQQQQQQQPHQYQQTQQQQHSAIEHSVAAPTVSPIACYPAYSPSGSHHSGGSSSSSRDAPDPVQSRALLRLAQTDHRSRADLQPLYLSAIRYNHARTNGPSAPLMSEIEELSLLANIEHAQLTRLVEQMPLDEQQQQAWKASEAERQHISDRWAQLELAQR